MSRETNLLRQQAEALARKGHESPLADELARFNAERAALLRGEPPTNDNPMPVPVTGAGGNV